MSAEERVLQVEFTTEDSFHTEYVTNISNGGIFVVTDDPIPLQEMIRVDLVLAYCDETVTLEGEVVHCIPPEMAETGARPGVAIQFSTSAAELRNHMEFLTGVEPVNERVARSGRRAAPRSPARLRTVLSGTSRGAVEVRTRDVSATGLLVSVQGQPLEIGEELVVTIVHPQTGETMQMEGSIVRHVTTDDGDVCAMGIELDSPEARRTEVCTFLTEARAAEHSRRLGGITGPIADLGIENLLQMFGSSSPEGTLIVTRGVEEGVIVFEGGMLRGVSAGQTRGADAMRRLMSWREGNFEFHARIDEADIHGDPVALNGALLDALCSIDEEGRESAPDSEVDVELELEEEFAGLDDAFGGLGDSGVGLDGSGTGLDDSGSEPDDSGSELDDSGAQLEGSGSEPEGSGVEIDDSCIELELNDVQEPEERPPPVAPKSVRRGRSNASPARLAPVSISADSVFKVDTTLIDAMRSELDKIEEAVLDLALVGMRAAKMIEVIPEPKAQIYRALESLVERGMIQIGTK